MTNTLLAILIGVCQLVTVAALLVCCVCLLVVGRRLRRLDR